MKLFFGKVRGNRYVIEINAKPLERSLEASLKVADKDNDCVYSISREFTHAWGSWTPAGIKKSLLDEYKVDND